MTNFNVNNLIIYLINIIKLIGKIKDYMGLLE